MGGKDIVGGQEKSMSSVLKTEHSVRHRSKGVQKEGWYTIPTSEKHQQGTLGLRRNIVLPCKSIVGKHV